MIDADALLADCQLAQKQADRHGREFANAFYSGGGSISTEWWCVEDMIENAPTIEPERKKGRWIECDHEKWSGDTFAYRCSECGGAYHLNIEQTIGVWDFCPACGSYNGGDQE